MTDYPSTEGFNIRSCSKLPVDAKILHDLSADLVAIAQCHASLDERVSRANPLAIIEGLNRAIAESDIVWELGSTAVLGLSPGIVMKAGCGIDIDHVPTMEYIKTRAPCVPIPDIHGVFQAGNRNYVFMTRIKGEALDQVWKSLNTTQKASIKEQLGPMFSSIRSVPPPPSDEPQAILGGGIPRRCKDVRRHIREAERPLENEAEFNQFLTSHPRRTETAWLAMIRSFLATDHKFVMTHGDLHPRNIMVTVSDVSSTHPSAGHVEITGLIDWEMCGYYPEYWEYVKALHTVSPGDGFDDWWAYLPVSIGVWPKEFCVDMLISRWMG
ncbi:hypothetical protein GX50_00288 [[Emmonsia] crescens]|uniref:Aminoglycoside phosphotransferase domain-containing protein n=1 Tax=[Emmonsia] crescens TaxID=73230 RepID=A0A2B7ZTV2_9EURO|nr:hypothetical protein GX50_00288 [Emmonsia crescens]